MTRRKRSAEENECRAKIRELLLSSNISSMDDIQDLFKETIAEFMESGLEAELDDELGYGRYDYRNKDTDNSRNGHSSKTLRTSYGDVEVAVPRDRKGEFEPRILKKNQTSVTPPYPDVKGKGCKQPGFAALDIRFRRRSGREKAVSVRPLPPHTSFCCLHSRRTFTQNSG